MRNPVAAYFALTFTISWTGAFLVAAPYLLRHEAFPKLAGILMFPVMLLGPSLAGIAVSRMTGGREGLRSLFSQMVRWRFQGRWYAALAIPPALVLVVLLGLKTFVSPSYSPNHFWLGASFGVPAGFLEEIGWTGCAFSLMSFESSGLAASVWLGVLWSLWHIPVVDYLGAVTPHRSYWLPFFLVFAAAMTVMRVLISWVYTNTKSVLSAQLMHVSSTGALVIFSPPLVAASQEVMWYGIYAAALWVSVAIVVKIFGKRLRRQIQFRA